MAEVLIEISCIIFVHVVWQNSATIAYVSSVHRLSWIIHIEISTQNNRRFYSRNFRDELREKKYRLWLQQAVFSVRVWSWSTLDAKNKAMVTLIVVGFLVFSDRERFLKIHTSSLSVLQSVLFMVRKLHNGNSGKILPKDITPQDFFEEERTDIDIVVIYRRLKFYDDFEFNNWFAFAWS